MAQTAKQLVLRMIDEVVNRRDLDLVDELVHPDFFSHEAAASRGSGPAGVKATILLLHESFAGLRVECRDIISEGAKVAARLRVSGRHVGEFNGIPPSGHEWSVQQIHIARVVDGRLIEHWASRDDLGALRQLGVLADRTIPAFSLRDTSGRLATPSAPVFVHSPYDTKEALP